MRQEPKERALHLLRLSLDDPHAQFREGQWEAIEGLLSRRRLLVVQKTGWGKSMVYFLATRLLRDEGAGPTLLISPLLSLMRNQIQAAERLQIVAGTINSTNQEDWDRVEEMLRDDKIDLLLISPERLANDAFRKKVLSIISQRVGLLVVDEAHCISDWGHDFRPNYQRIVDVLNALPQNIPVLATTATANNRVVEDIVSQLGNNLRIVRGPLCRITLRLQNISMPSRTDRMAWLAQTIPSLPGSGIVYTLTTRDADIVAAWLRHKGMSAEAYHAGIDGSAGASQGLRQQLEEQLLSNEVKVLVATVALGMGFDKRDLGFVIHFQRPASVVHYYQQVGRAGRAVDEAYGILLHGAEDDDIAKYFQERAFPPQADVDVILSELQAADGGLSVRDLEPRLNIPFSRLRSSLEYMSVQTPAPVVKIGAKWHATAASEGYRIDRAQVERIQDLRKHEQEEMNRYVQHTGCLMEFLAAALDDPAAGPCGVCAGCVGGPLWPTQVDPELANEAAEFLRGSWLTFQLRTRWPKDAFPVYGFKGSIGNDLRADEGCALCQWGDAGWGELVVRGKYETGRFEDELVEACVKMIQEWSPMPTPQWVTCIPSLSRSELVPDFARRLASKLGVSFVETLKKAKQNWPQKEMENSFHQARNLDGVFTVDEAAVRSAPCFLVDDLVDSRWTMTVGAALLRRAGCEAVFALALARAVGGR